MPNPISILSYPDVKLAFDRALKSEAGVRVAFETRREATHFYGRCNSFRVLDRKDNLTLYPDPGHTLHGRSNFDALRIIQRDTDILIVPVVLNEGRITDLEIDELEDRP